MKKIIATLTTAGVLTLGGAGTALAAEGNGGSGTNDPTTTTQPTKPCGEQRADRRAIRRAALRAALEAAASTIGVDPADLKAAVKGGQTIAEFAQSKGVDVADVEAAIVKALSDKVDQAVADGKVPANRAEKIKQRLPQLAEKVVNFRRGERGHRGQGGQTSPSSQPAA